MFRPFRHHVETPIKRLHYVYDKVTYKNNRTRFYYVRPTAGKHGFASTPKIGEFIFGQFDDKERFSVFITRKLIDEQRTQQNDSDTHEIHQGRNPPRITEEHACKQCDNGQFCAARHKGRQHSRGSSFSFVTNSAASHNAGNGATRTDNERDNGFARKPHFFEDRIEHDGSTRHIAAIFQNRNQEIHHHNERQEPYYGYHAADYAVD